MAQGDLETLPISRSEFLALEIFKNVSFESIAGYLLSCKTISVEPNEILINPSNAERRLIILLEGKLGVRLEAQGGSYGDDINPGDCAGEMSIFDNVKPSATVFAIEKSRLLIIPPDIALAMINASHDLCLNFLHLLSQRIRKSNKVVCEDQFHIQCIEEKSKVDALTGLHNRHWLEEMYEREMQRSNAGHFDLCTFMLDIDHFKHVNDTYGHLAGDQVLRAVAQELSCSLRPSDMPVRYGGEEFTVFLPGTTMENAMMIAERIRSNIEKMKIALMTGQMLQVTISLGITMRVDGDSVQSIIDRADSALYTAKNSGRNQISVA